MSKGTVVAGVVIGVVVVAVAGLFVADRVVASTAENRAVQAIEQNLDGVVGTPTVEIGGFPFLTQVLAGSLDEVSGQIDGVTIGGIAATDVTVDAKDVTTNEPYTAGSATISATLPTASINTIVADQTQLDITVTVDGGALTATGKLLGVTLAANLVPRVVDGKLLVDVSDLSVGGLSVSVDSLPAAIGKRLSNIEVPVSGLPDGLVLTEVRVVDGGVRITASGTDVVIPTTTP